MRVARIASNAVRLTTTVRTSEPAVTGLVTECRATDDGAFPARRRCAMYAAMSAAVTSASGVVRASRIIRSECCTREIQTFCPDTK